MLAQNIGPRERLATVTASDRHSLEVQRSHMLPKAPLLHGAAASLTAIMPLTCNGTQWGPRLTEMPFSQMALQPARGQVVQTDVAVISPLTGDQGARLLHIGGAGGRFKLRLGNRIIDWSGYRPGMRGHRRMALHESSAVLIIVIAQLHARHYVRALGRAMTEHRSD